MNNEIQNYRVQHVAERLGVSRATIWNYIKQGRLISKKLSPRVTIVESKELQRFMDNLE